MPPTRAPLLPSVILLLATLGCPSGGVPLRADGSPASEKCPEEALKTMRILRMHVSDSADVQLDANQIDASPITLYDGPVESYLDGSLGTLGSGTRLYGRVWTSGPLVVVRYYEAKPPDGDTVPICAVARLGDGQLRKRPESKPGTAILDYPGASVFVVDSFR
ncbi:serine/threonine protein kinase [Vitiosangium sp. GDMCC 1.1324]|uniref:serine/threonine protein kinase n=1 Tax=Vitiosangium sp. (strain GDMCC 1.1324) TaxID=2138576 RepID=UPI000D38787F|nr:serine/threonine protein kinase [Vitiosangium sp. GDMCC 1.1324]PTL77168.1 serine/threonine protein kinase [Vitiosangium sp. GDMCC 1.1324]